MTYAAVGALTQEEQRTVQAAIAELPPCYSDRFHRCYVDRETNTFPNCRLLLDAYEVEGNAGQLERTVQRLPFCAAPRPEVAAAAVAPVGGVGLWVALAAGVGVAAGYAIWGRKS